MEKLKIVNVGAPNFYVDLRAQNADVLNIHWKPPMDGNIDIAMITDEFITDERVHNANREAVMRIMDAAPVLVGIKKAVDAIPGMDDNTILHSGPPIDWERMCNPMQGAVVGALIYEGKAKNEAEAKALAASGKINFHPCHSFHAVGPMAGVISPSMPVHIIKNKTHGNFSFCTVNEGLGKVLRFGAFSEEVIIRLKWIQDCFMPVMSAAIGMAEEGIELKTIIAQAVQMGDECHNRNKAATSLFFKEIVPLMLKTGLPQEQIIEAIQFIKGNDHYFLNLSMPACKSALDAADNIPYSSIVTAMCRNGVDFGIKISGLGSDQWFTAPAGYIMGLLFPGYVQEDANPDMGDSAITETMGIGGFAMGASPAIIQFVGGTVEDAVGYSKSMQEITTCRNSAFALPPLNFTGTATGIDIFKVADSGILPVINTGIAHRKAGVGQIGAGIVHPPIDCFYRAIRAFGNKYQNKREENQVKEESIGYE